MKEKRKSRRFELKLPFRLLHGGIGIEGETRNLSSAGVLFDCPIELSIGQPIEYVITLPTKEHGASVKLRCVGKVVRTHSRNDTENGCLVATAATLERYEFVHH